MDPLSPVAPGGGGGNEGGGRNDDGGATCLSITVCTAADIDVRIADTAARTSGCGPNIVTVAEVGLVGKLIWTFGVAARMPRIRRLPPFPKKYARSFFTSVGCNLMCVFAYHRLSRLTIFFSVGRSAEAAGADGVVAVVAGMAALPDCTGSRLRLAQGGSSCVL